MFNSNISGFNTTSTLQAVNSTGTGGTFPIPVPLTMWADDVDGIDFTDLQIGDTKNGPNGNMVSWQTSNSIEVVFAPIVGSIDDIVFQTLFRANMPSPNKTTAQDNVTIIILYPDLISSIQLNNGIITSGVPGKGLASSGRLKTRTYKLRFQSYSGGL